MRKTLLGLVGMAFFVVGCSDQHAHHDHAHMDMPHQKPAPAPEMKKLSRMVGSWTGTAEMMGPMADEMKKEGMPTTFTGGATYQWTMDGMYLMSEGWHEMGPDMQMKMLEYIAWDSKEKKYRTAYFSDWGEMGESFMKMSPDGNSMTIEARMMDSNGTRRTGTGSMKFVNNNTMEWTWKESNGMSLKGTMTRKM